MTQIFFDGTVIIGDPYQIWSPDGAYFRDVTVFGASVETQICFIDYGGSCARSGDRLDIQFRQNTPFDQYNTQLIRQIIHLSGHAQDCDASLWYCYEDEIADLFGSYRPFHPIQVYRL